MSLRLALATIAAKSTAMLSKIFGLGSGSALPGRIALAIYPDLLRQFKEQINQKAFKQQIKTVSVVVTGTNGKTTTTGILEQMLEENGYSHLTCNHHGANLHYGVVTAFALNTDLSGKLKSPHYIIEADEAALASITAALRPRIIIVTNLYRDQLDRFGELDSTEKLINKGIEASYLTLDSAPALVLNADDKRVIKLAAQLEQRYLFTVESTAKISNLDSNNEVCAINKNARTTNIKVEHEGLEGSDITVSGSQNYQLHLKLPGLYNAYNFAAAATAAELIGLNAEQIKASVDHYHCNFGRAETRVINGVASQTFLIKNPTGCTEVLKLLENNQEADFLIAINDNYADGRDVSWLWDAEWQRLAGLKQARFYCSGHRAEDMALRLNYAGIEAERLKTLPAIASALKQSIKNAQLSARKLYILPTYTALLELEKI